MVFGSKNAREIDDASKLTIRTKGIKRIDISGNNFKSFWSFHAGCDPIEHINADNNKIECFSAVYWLRPLDNLRGLSLQGNPVVKLEGYRKIILNLLPSLEVLDKKPVTPEERIESQKYTKRSFSTLNMLLQYVTNIRLLKSMIAYIEKKKEIRNEEPEQEEPMEYHRVMKVVSTNMREEVMNSETEWCVDILDDIDSLVGELRRQEESAEFVYDRAFISMLQLQLDRVQELKEDVETKISEFNKIVPDETLQMTSLRTEDIFGLVNPPVRNSTAGRQSTDDNRELFQSAETVPHRRTVNAEDGLEKRRYKEDASKSEYFKNVSVHSSSKNKDKPPFQLSTRLSSKSPPNNLKSKEIQRKIDELIIACYEKDREIEQLISRNAEKKQEYKALDEKLKEMKTKEKEVKEKESLKEKLIREREELKEIIDLIPEKEEELERLIQRSGKMKEEKDQLEKTLKELVEQETNEEAADGLRKYHLYLKFFQAIRDHKTQSRLEEIVDRFREGRLKYNMIQELKNSTSENRRQLVVHTKMGLKTSKHSSQEEVDEEISKKFFNLRRTSWIKLFFEKWIEYTEIRENERRFWLQSENFNQQRLKRLIINLLRSECSVFTLRPLEFKVKYMKAEEKINDSKLKRIWGEWLSTSSKIMKPIMATYHEKVRVIDNRILAHSFGGWKEWTARMKANREIITNRHANWLQKHCLKQWIDSQRDLKKKQQRAEKKMKYNSLKRSFNLFKKGLAVQDKEKYEEERRRKVDEDRTERERESQQRQNEIQEYVDSNQFKAAEEFHSNNIVKWMFLMLKEEYSKKKAVTKLNEVLRLKEERIVYDAIYSSVADEAREKEIEIRLDIFRRDRKARRKRMVLKIFKQACDISRNESERVENCIEQHNTVILRRAWRSLKKEYVEIIKNKIRRVQKDLLVEGEQDKRNERNRISLQNENEFLQVQNREVEIRLNEKKDKVEELKSNYKKMEDTKNILSMKIETIELELEKKKEEGMKRSKEMEEELVKRKEKVRVLKQSQKDAEIELKSLDKHLEGRLW